MVKIKSSDWQNAKQVKIKDSGSYFTGTEVESALQIIGKSRADSYHYTGFPNRDDTSIAWDDGTYTLTLTASDDKIWISGVEYNIDTLTKTFTSGGGSSQEETSGLYWFWITAPGGVPQLNTSTTVLDIGSGGANAGFDQCLVAVVYWNTTTSKGLMYDERHWFGRDAWMHEYLHETVGARFYEGMAGTFGNTTFEVEAGEFYDEDIEHTNSAETVATILYHDGDNDWKWDTNVSTPYKTDGTDLQYNNGTTLASVGNNRYVNYFVFITPDSIDPVHIIIGTATYTTAAGAAVAAVPSLGALPGEENKLIYKITYKNNSGGTPAYQSTTDFRTSSLLPTTGYVPTDHGSLAGLSDDDHTQYILHSLADATNDFLVASGANTYVKKTLAETGAILEADIDHGNIQGLSTGADHSYIDQDVTIGSGPAFTSIQLTTPVLGTPTSGTLTNCDGTASSLVAGAVTNATFTTALTVNTGTLTLTADVGNDSVLTIGGGAVSVSGSNTGDQDLSGYALKGANTDITSLQNAALYVGRDTDNRLNWTTDDQLDIVIGGETSSIVSVSTGVADNDKLVTQGYVDDNATGADTALSNLASVAINTSLVSDTDNTDALGTAAIGWSDLFLGNESVITWSTAPSTADVTLTHAANLLTFAGGTIALGTATATSLDVGATTLYASRAITVDTGGVLNIVLAGAAGDDFTVDTDKLVVEGDTGNVGIGTATPTAYLHLKAGTADASTAPIKLTSGTVNTTPEAGTIEFDGTDLFISV